MEEDNEEVKEEVKEEDKEEEGLGGLWGGGGNSRMTRRCIKLSFIILTMPHYLLLTYC